MDTSTAAKPPLPLPRVYVDRNRHTYLMFRDNEKTRQYVSMVNGQIEIIQLTRREWKELIRYKECTPEHFAEVYLKSTQDMSRQARAILKSILGQPEEKLSPTESPRFPEGSISLQQLCEVYNWNPSKVRKQLRKLMNKPGGRWNFTPDEADKIVTMVKECLHRENTSD